jgi:hypothetical protein
LVLRLRASAAATEKLAAALQLLRGSGAEVEVLPY